MLAFLPPTPSVLLLLIKSNSSELMRQIVTVIYHQKAFPTASATHDRVSVHVVGLKSSYLQDFESH